MTVIAANKEMLCGDSQFTRGDLASKGTKVYEVNGDFIGFCGDIESAPPFIEWYSKSGDTPTLGDNFTALVLTKRGKLLEYGESCVPIPVFEKYHAIGSGSHFAIGAMAAGATPEEAVRLTCKRIDGCSLPVVVKRRAT